MFLYFGKKTWYKKSMGRTFSKQNSSSTNWDIVGRELATLDEISKMPKGYCILFVATVGAFYSKLYNLEEHQNYSNLYEPWRGNVDKLYEHREELEYQRNSAYRLLCNVGLAFAKTIEISKIEKVDRNELKQLYKYGVIQFEELKDKD